MTIDFDAAIQYDHANAKPPTSFMQQLDPDYSCQVLREQFLPLIEKMAGQAEAHQVVDDGSYKNAIAMAGQARELAKKLDAARKDVIAEPDGFVRRINRFVKGFKDRLDEIESRLKQKIAVHAQQIEQERREAERKAREEAARLQAELDKKAKETNTEAVQVAPPVVPQQKVTRADTGAAVHMRKVWEWELEDISKVPVEYLEVKATAVNQAVKAGIREIPGIRIFDTEKAVLRA